MKKLALLLVLTLALPAAVRASGGDQELEAGLNQFLLEMPMHFLDNPIPDSTCTSRDPRNNGATYYVRDVVRYKKLSCNSSRAYCEISSKRGGKKLRVEDVYGGPFDLGQIICHW